jgi:hypothetical protein
MASNRRDCVAPGSWTEPQVDALRKSWIGALLWFVQFNRNREIQMSRVQMFSLSLAAVLAGPAYAQICSGGGNDGGTDATGNQCNTPIEVAVFATGSVIAPPTQVTKVGNVRALTSAAQPAIRTLAKTSSQNPVPAVMAVPTSAKLQIGALPSATAKIAKTAMTAAGSEAFCSGGAGGGMDVNGNECGEASASSEISGDLREHAP